MMKIIKIDCCWVCPFKAFRYPTTKPGFQREYYCTHQAVDGIIIEDFKTIHSDCPLEDYKKRES